MEHHRNRQDFYLLWTKVRRILKRWQDIWIGGIMGVKNYLKVMAWQAQKAEQNLTTTNRLTVLVQDNAPIHTSHKCQAQWLKWQQQGLFLFQLPKYSAEMNPIETEWHQLKTHEIAGRMFDNEYDLALSITDVMHSRARLGTYSHSG
jgi:putative transposase